MREAAVVINTAGEAIHWHLPVDRTAVAIPDQRSLWEVLWDHREEVLGVAHTHPGAGVPGPSYEDVTTFAPIEAALGRRLNWWIATSDKLVLIRWSGPDRLSYQDRQLIHVEPPWLERLRRESV